MNRAWRTASLALWVGALSAAFFLGSAPAAPSRFRAVLGKMVEAFNQGHYEAIGADFNEGMKKGLPDEELRKVFSDLKRKYGTVEEIEEGKSAAEGSMVFPLRFSSGAVLDFEVVLDQEGKVAGLWSRPHAPGTPSPAGVIPRVLFVLVCGLFVLLFPPIFGYRLSRFWKVSYGIFWAAVGLFWLIQIPHVLLLQFLTFMVEKAGHSAFMEENKVWINAVTLGFLAALFERGGQAILFAFFLKRLKTVRQAMLFALGWGGGEAMVLVGLSFMLVPLLLILLPVIQAADPSAAADVQQAIAQLTAGPWFSPLTAVMERTSAVIFHLLGTLLVFLAVRYRRPAFFFIAFFLHFLLDGISVIAADWSGLTLSPIYSRLLFFEFSLLAFSLFLIPFIRALFREYAAEEARATPESLAPPPPA